MSLLQELRPGCLTQTSSRTGALVVAAGMIAGSLIGGVWLTDVLTLSCSKAQDRCTFQSLGALQGGSFEGQVRLSEVDYLGADGQTTRTAPSRTFTRARHVFVLKDRQRVPLEPRQRSVLVGDLIPEQFSAFRRSGEDTLSAFAVHLGHLGFFLPVLIAIAGVIALLAERREVIFDLPARRFRVSIRGVRAGRSEAEGSTEEIAGIEHVPRGSNLGTYLVLRDGRRINLDRNFQLPLAQELSQRLSLPLQATTSEAIAQLGAGQSLAPSLLLLLAAFLPLLVQIGWGLVAVLWGIALR